MLNFLPGQFVLLLLHPTPEQFAAFIHAEIAANAKLIKFIGMKPE